MVYVLTIDVEILCNEYHCTRQLTCIDGDWKFPGNHYHRSWKSVCVCVGVGVALTRDMTMKQTL